MDTPSFEPGSSVDGYIIEGALHRGGMASLFAVHRDDNPMPMVMKIPRTGEGEDPAAIVSFEMEQMLMPRLHGPHVPQFVALADFSTHPYIVMERIAGEPLLGRLPDLPLPYDEAIAIAAKIATAVADLHRQHVIHHDIKPSNIMFRPSGEAVMLDMGLACSDQLPDLMQEEFRLPFGTAPYMAPERLLGVRNDPRSDLFGLGVLLYFFTTGIRPFGETETMYGMRRRLWRDPVPPRKLRPDYPPWLQEVVLRCLEIQPEWRYPTAAQLVFDLTHPSEVKLTTRSEKLKRDALRTVLRRRFNKELTQPRRETLAAHLASAPIVAVAIDLTDGSVALNDELRVTAGRILATLPSARLACLNVLKLGRMTIDRTLDEHGHNKHVDRLVALRHWAEPLKLSEDRLTAHVLEAVDPASAILEFAQASRVDHILIGARRNSMLRTLGGSVSAKVASEAGCTVTIVRDSALRQTRSGKPANVQGSRDEI
ncbi:bifunctional serine/threonine-protein kinase/universal stress protein [Rhodopseudomonas sp. HC1]|uniref:serine/threonine protein kinase n=1 Tax=Rhodopseudomonas infernalis TaxID=2897386 RepID=UPI001EE9541B|nr:bifunctional serine/threonine-protein kinase/universal stress protein [Rhodopseudomonas infernalis]MCG6206244.1 bifunctional serine/threonine-protein kinase/universal stress protein [Rhodopseudomonas infernalis]